MIDDADGRARVKRDAPGAGAGAWRHTRLRGLLSRQAGRARLAVQTEAVAPV